MKVMSFLSMSSPVAHTVFSSMVTAWRGGICVCFMAEFAMTSNREAMKPGMQLTSSDPIPISCSGSSITFPIVWSRRRSISLSASSTSLL